MSSMAVQSNFSGWTPSQWLQFTVLEKSLSTSMMQTLNYGIDNKHQNPIGMMLFEWKHLWHLCCTGTWIGPLMLERFDCSCFNPERRFSYPCTELLCSWLLTAPNLPLNDGVSVFVRIVHFCWNNHCGYLTFTPDILKIEVSKVTMQFNTFNSFAVREFIVVEFWLFRIT